MNNIILSFLSVTICLAAVAQRPVLHPGLRTASYKPQKALAEPLKALSGIAEPRPHNRLSASPRRRDLTVIDLGTASNALSYGYAGGQRTMVWADDSLKAVINIHGMGPGSTPAGLTGYLAVDIGVNMGATQDDWTNNYQVYAATLNQGGPNLADEARYPQGGVYNPPGNTDPGQASVVFFAPNLSTPVTTWGGYSYGVTSLGTPSDSTKHLYWYDPPPYTYIPDGFTLTHNGIALVADIDRDWESGSMVYKNNIILHRGTWNQDTHDFEYTLNNLVPLLTLQGGEPTSIRVTESPYGHTVWAVAIGDNGNAGGTAGLKSLYPIVFKSMDDGMTWSDPIPIQLDGPAGISGIVDQMLSDYRITQTFLPPYLARDEISYTTAYDCDLVVDACENPHIGVIVGLTGQDPYSIVIGEPGDSLLAAYDLYSPDGGYTWEGAKMGTVQTFRGYFGSITEDNRINMSVTEDGHKVFCTWLDTQLPGVTDNNSPDVFARGFDILKNKLTSKSGISADNVTGNSEIDHQAWFQCTSHYAFTDNNGGFDYEVILPICTELLSDPNDETQPVFFKYIAGVKYTPADFMEQNYNYPPCWVGIDNIVKEASSLKIIPNPVKAIATLALSGIPGGIVIIQVTNPLGQTILRLNKGWVDPGPQTFTLDASDLRPGVYFCTVIINGQYATSKLIVE